MLLKKKIIISSVAILALAILGFVVQQRWFRAVPSLRSDEWSGAAVVVDLTEKTMGSSNCGDREFLKARQEIAKRDVRRLTFGGGFRVYRTANPLLWTDTQFRAFNLNQRAICDVGVFYPLRAATSYLYWVTSCGGATENLACDEAHKRIAAEYDFKYGQPPIGFTWIQSDQEQPGKAEGLVRLLFFRSLPDSQALLGTKEKVQRDFYRNLSGQFEFLTDTKTVFTTSSQGFTKSPIDAWNVIVSSTKDRVAQAVPPLGSDSAAQSSSQLVEVRNTKHVVTHSFRISKYGSEWQSMEPIAFSTDEQSLVIRLWGLRGGDLVDRQGVVLQSLKDDVFSFITKSPDPFSTNEKTERIIATVLTDARPTGERLFFSQIEYDNWRESFTTLLQYDLRNKKLTKIIEKLPGRVLPIWSPLGTVGISQNEHGLIRVSVTKGSFEDVTQTEGSCSIEGVSNDGRYFASSCFEGTATIIKVTDLEEKKSWDVLRSSELAGAQLRFVSFFNM